MMDAQTAKKILELKPFLDGLVDRFNRKHFIAGDPISIPHKFIRRQDIEISGLFAATLAWGQRKMIIRSCEALLGLMDNAPHQFITGYRDSDLKRLVKFVHRTFNSTDLLYFVAFLRHHFERHETLEELFCVSRTERTVEEGLVRFHAAFFSLPDFPLRTLKHVATPERKSACKRLNMFLRWMVRRDDRGVDFGLWKKILPSQLVIPCDLHVERVARSLGLVTRKSTDWQMAVGLTELLRHLDPHDPVRYDFALFGLGVESKGK